MTSPSPVDVSSLTRPIIYLESRTPLEVFDIMCERIRANRASHNTEADALRELVERQLSGKHYDRCKFKFAPFSECPECIPKWNKKAGAALKQEGK